MSTNLTLTPIPLFLNPITQYHSLLLKHPTPKLNYALIVTTAYARKHADLLRTRLEWVVLDGCCGGSCHCRTFARQKSLSLQGFLREAEGCWVGGVVTDVRAVQGDKEMLLFMRRLDLSFFLGLICLILTRNARDIGDIIFRMRFLSDLK